MNSTYECVFILNPDPALVKTSLQEVQDVITREGGEIRSKDEWGRRRLAYPIKGSFEGHYILVQFDILPEKVARLKNLYQLNEKILRFLIVRFDPRWAERTGPVRETDHDVESAYSSSY